RSVQISQEPSPDCSLPVNPKEHPTSNIQRRTSNGSANSPSLQRSVFDVGCSMFSLGSDFERLVPLCGKSKCGFRIRLRATRKPAMISELRFDFYCWPADGGGMMCSASQDWKLSSDSTILTKPFAIT